MGNRPLGSVSLTVWERSAACGTGWHGDTNAFYWGGGGGRHAVTVPLWPCEKHQGRLELAKIVGSVLPDLYFFKLSPDYNEATVFRTNIEETLRIHKISLAEKKQTEDTSDQRKETIANSNRICLQNIFKASIRIGSSSCKSVCKWFPAAEEMKARLPRRWKPVCQVQYEPTGTVNEECHDTAKNNYWVWRESHLQR